MRLIYRMYLGYVWASEKLMRIHALRSFPSGTSLDPELVRVRFPVQRQCE
jgi:hypothetical protein